MDDTSSLSVGEVSARTRSLAERAQREGRRLGFIVIDYLKYLKASSQYRGQRHYEIGEICGGLKSLAKELNIVVILLAQLNREVEKRDDKRPQLSDLRESGDIEADADTVLFLFREEYYPSKLEPKPGTPEHMEWQTKIESCHNRLEIIVTKQRSGPTDSSGYSVTPQHSYALDLVATITRLQASSPTKLAVRCPLGAEPRDRDQHLQAGAMRHDADQAGRWVVRGAGRDDGAGG
ncbi:MULTISPECIES: DnaB-like helicase C-terminal domain-containing protein [Bradyrhizobium]|uniref:DnaB-like helicase C-terminal domain-containing protein n=1 Tax=Bradyrhizobium TaxID=374 RepID=UPI0009F9C67A|nr:MULTISPECIES: DnaB-like helicase C-terminal domain-containing protein [Bradyrhizobium]NLS67872.1 hypothetical protein [Bradyrhizobium brasilense]